VTSVFIGRRRVGAQAQGRPASELHARGHEVWVDLRDTHVCRANRVHVLLRVLDNND